MTSPTTAHRPLGVGFLSTLFMVVGAIEVIGGISILAQATDDDAVNHFERG